MLIYDHKDEIPKWAYHIKFPNKYLRMDISAEEFVIINNVIHLHNILSIFVIHYVIKLIYEEN